MSASDAPSKPRSANRRSAESRIAWRLRFGSLAMRRTLWFGRMTTATEALSDTARNFVSGPQKLLIGPDWVDAADGRTFDTIDPSTGEVICQVAQAGAEDVDRAVQAATAAFEGPWAKMPAAGRSKLINK